MSGPDDKVTCKLQTRDYVGVTFSGIGLRASVMSERAKRQTLVMECCNISSG